ncbi:MAG: hypothetical protein WC919_02855, partial [Candidatus Paceibacterota bacterium]
MALMDSWSATDVSAELVPANYYRDKLVIQIRTSDPCSIAFGEDAVYADGVQLTTTDPTIYITGALSREAVY